MLYYNALLHWYIIMLCCNALLQLILTMKTYLGNKNSLWDGGNLARVLYVINLCGREITAWDTNTLKK